MRIVRRTFKEDKTQIVYLQGESSEKKKFGSNSPWDDN